MSKIFEGLSIYEFQDQFGDDRSCIDALVEMKWPKDYSCRYCGHKKYCNTLLRKAMYKMPKTRVSHSTDLIP